MYDFQDNVQLALSFELSYDLLVIQRQVYSLLDLLGDLGGLASSLYTLFFVSIVVMQFKAAVSYVSNHTYLIRDGDEKPKSNQKSTKQDPADFKD